jgi:general secretion pathway protein I
MQSRHPPPRHTTSAQHRHGLTLLEVLVSTAIFVGSLVGIMQILNTGHKSQIESILDAEAVLRCETVMGEILAGVHPMNSTDEQTFDDNANWVWAATVTDQGSTSLLVVEVEVKHKIAGDRVNSYSVLNRYVRDPQLFLEAAGATE